MRATRCLQYRASILAGIVEAVGQDVEAFQEGDAVYGMTGGVGGLPGSLAEYAAVDATLLATKPANLTMREAAAVPLVFITAWEGLVDRAGARAGQKVLIQGGPAASVTWPYRSRGPSTRRFWQPDQPGTWRLLRNSAPSRSIIGR
jgi:hypothetical protein